MGMPGLPEMLIIFLVVLLVFGAKRIPEIARGIGQGIREFKSASSEITKEITREDQQIRNPQPPRQGMPTPRSTAQHESAATETAPPEPARADNPSAAKPEETHS